jgi:hypothetical protein
VLDFVRSINIGSVFHSLHQTTVCPLLLGLAVLAPATAAGDHVAALRVSSVQLEWTPQVRAEGWTLSVSGEGIYWRKVFESGDPPTLSLTAPDGKRLPDGRYNWELRAVKPEQSRESRRGMLGEERRDELEDADEGRRVAESGETFVRRRVRRPVVTSGSFRIQNGSVVMPKREEREGW